MTRRTTLVMALAAGALLAGLAVPAHAAGDPKLVVSRQVTFHLTGQTPEARGSVHTQTAGNNDTVEFEAIFDRQFRSDPRCFVSTARF
jgi:hypothetical protein